LTAPVAAPFVFDRAWSFAVPPEHFWTTIADTGRYREWWPWLREFDGAPLEPGVTTRCVIQAPLPYALDLLITVDDVVPASSVDVRISGDLVGPARLEVGADGEGCSARLRWSLRLEDRWLRRVARVARPAMVWAHDRVVDVGVRRFERVALDGQTPPTG
jgi:hypothetical protein